jgi:predicted DCC family thiol-disulfide oxidoreductase YuxK
MKLVPKLPPLLTAYVDGQCSLCAAEMKAIQALDAHCEITWIDCAAADFDDTAPRAQGITQAQLLSALHVRDILGDWHTGVDAIALLYCTVGAPLLARAWAHPVTRPFTKRLYAFVVQHRHRLSAWGLHRVAPAARREASYFLGEDNSGIAPSPSLPNSPTSA